MERLTSSVMTLACALFLAACTGGGGGGDGSGTTPPGQTGTGGGTDTPTTGGQTGGTTNGNVTVPEIFYGGWGYTTATLYEDGKEPIVSRVSGDATFDKDLSYEQNYSIGGIGNFYKGRYTVDGPDPRTAGSFLITTYDEDDKEAFKFSVACGGDTKAMALTIYDDAGKPSIIYGLVSREE